MMIELDEDNFVPATPSDGEFDKIDNDPLNESPNRSKRCSSELPDQNEKKLKFQEDAVVIEYVNQPISPDLFEGLDGDSFVEHMNEEDGSIAKDDQCDGNDLVANENVSRENPLVSNEQATPPDPFSPSRDLCSDKTKKQIGGIILALKSQTQQISPIQPQQQPPAELRQEQEQEQPENDPQSISFENLPVEELIEQLSLSHERIAKSIDDIKESS